MKKLKPGLLFLSIFVVVVAAASSHSQSGPYLSHAPRGPISGGARLTSRDRPEVGNDAANAQQQKRRRCYFLSQIDRYLRSHSITSFLSISLSLSLSPSFSPSFFLSFFFLYGLSSFRCNETQYLLWATNIMMTISKNVFTSMLLKWFERKNLLETYFRLRWLRLY